MATKPPPSHMLDYVELYLIGQVHEAGLTRAEVARRLGINKSTVGRHFDLEATYSRNGGPDGYVSKMAACLNLEPAAIWKGALDLWQGDPRGTLPRTVRRQIAARRAESSSN